MIADINLIGGGSVNYPINLQVYSNSGVISRQDCYAFYQNNKWYFHCDCDYTANSSTTSSQLSIYGFPKLTSFPSGYDIHLDSNILHYALYRSMSAGTTLTLQFEGEIDFN